MLYMNQRDYRHVPYLHNTDNGGAPEERRNICTSGCGLCSACMVVEHLTTRTLELTECVRIAEESGANHCAGCDIRILGPIVAERFGLEFSITKDMEAAIDHLRSGGEIIANVHADENGRAIFTNTRHYVVLVSTAGREFCILDPNYFPGKFRAEEKAGVLRVEDPFIYCPVEVLHREASRSEKPYSLFKRK